VNKGTKARRNITLADSLPFDETHYKELWRRQVFRLLLNYLGPLLIVLVYFSIQYNRLAFESRQIHLQEIARNHANTVSLFLIERIANLENLIDDPDLSFEPTTERLESHLQKLVRVSETFVDLGYLVSGIQVKYAGSYSNLVGRDYSSEEWYRNLSTGTKSYVVTDIYLGFRQRPHFTIGVKRVVGEKLVVLRASLDPERIYNFIRSNVDTQEVSVSIVNREGYYQVVTTHIGSPLEASQFVPPVVPEFGAESIDFNGIAVDYAYCWLQLADWALIIQPSSNEAGWIGVPLNIFLFTAPIALLLVLVILSRARKLVNLQMEADRTRAQLEHAAKLASVGELAAGIAHEINNPLAVINEEAGLLKDLMDPELSNGIKPEELNPHLDGIRNPRPLGVVM